MDYSSQMIGKMSFKFDGETSIDVDLLTRSLYYVAQAYKSCMVAHYGDDAEISIDICAFQPGSFEVILQSVVDIVPVVMSQAPHVVECTKNFIEMIKNKRELKGLTPKSVDSENGKTRIVNSEGNISYHNSNVYNFYLNNSAIDSSLSNAFAALAESLRPAVSFKAEDSTTTTVTIPQEAYSEMRTPIVDEILPADLQRMESTVTEALLLKSPDFLGNSKWGFFYNGKTILASIEDESFKQRVRSGNVKLSAGVKIPVKMRIEAFLDEKLEVKKHNYTITEVLGDIIEPAGSNYDQQSLFK